MNKRQIGIYFENIFADYLKNKGFTVLERNFIFGKISEIDIIAVKDRVLHFVEVKARSSGRYGLPIEAVSKDKIRRIKSAAKYYIHINNAYDLEVSMDIGEVYFSVKGETISADRIIHHENVF